MFRGSRRRLVGVLVAGCAVLAVAGAAFAYFTASGSGNGSATVGSSSPWNVAVSTSSATFSGSLTAIYPGEGTEYIPFTIANAGNGNQKLASDTPSIMTNSSTGDAETISGADISGCTATWFNVSNDSSNPSLANVDLTPGSSYSGKVDVTMTDASTDQGACQGKAPGVTVTAG